MAKAAESSTSLASPRWSLNGMTALVTGGTRGIGSLYLFQFLRLRCLNVFLNKNLKLIFIEMV